MTKHVIITKNPEIHQTLYPSNEPFKIYLPQVHDVTHYFNFPEGIKISYSVSSPDYIYEMNLWSNGKYLGVFKGDPDGTIPSTNNGQLRFRATAPDQLITIKVNKSE